MSKKARQDQKKYNSNSNKNLYNKITMKTNYLDAQNILPKPVSEIRCCWIGGSFSTSDTSWRVNIWY